MQKGKNYMQRQITFAQYRTIDLTILMVILAVCQGVIHLAATYWFPWELYIASPVAAVVALVMMRWGAYAGIHACLGGLVFAVISGGTWQHILIYSLGNLLGLLALGMLKLMGKETIRKNSIWAMAFGLLTQALMWLGRAGVAAVLGFSADACLGFVTTDVLSGLFTLVIIWIVRRIDGLFEDQKNYLLRIQQTEQKIEGREQF